MKHLQDVFTLSNGVQSPCVGFGTYKMNDENTTQAIENAIACGYRHIDTAAFYENEQNVGEAVRRSGKPQEGIRIFPHILPFPYRERRTSSAEPREY